ncbi:hypothetical protein [Microcoleus sp. B4-D4]|uniref:hypothetical protein n=1 Tax=Microcoleus sp. B4-D4 TaxID=2818667 RepID=UPI002FD3F282
MLHLPDICGFWIDRLHLGFVKSIFCLSGGAIALQMFAHRLLIWAIALKTVQNARSSQSATHRLPTRTGKML